MRRRIMFFKTFSPIFWCFLAARLMASSLHTQEHQAAVWKGHDGPVTDFVFSPAGDFAVSSSLDGTVRIWATQMGNTVKVLTDHKSEVFAVAIFGNGPLVASTDYSGAILVYTIDGKLKHRLTGFPGWAVDVAVSPDGTQAAAWAMDGGIWIWNLDSGGLIRKLEGEKNRWGMALAWSPDNKLLAAGRVGVTIWNAESGEKVKTLEGHRDFVRDLAFSAGGRFLASAAMDKTVRIWNLESGELMHTLQPEGFVVFTKSGPVSNPISVPMTCVCFSGDGTLLATGGADRVVRLWEAKTGKMVRQFEGHRRTVTAVCFSPDGKRLGSASLDRTIRIWQLDK